ncbi:c-type cytochrome [Leisingera sp. ANG-Vp]|uniref:c-type cytochrome n=1 Tax=Leisingera sp. ANG-Vp TaxID=1577896 RepID=UPI00057E7CAF|nr:cytochrome c [Leisingera sp. ANG-Vp]KIC13954.1 cytochrome C [Leisingera sp. ANG-Vp]
MNARRHKAAVFLAVIAALAIGSSAPSTAGSGYDKHVARRIALMTSQKAALDELTGMMAGRSTFDQDRARAARRLLVKSTKSIRKHFKKPRLDPRSNARPLIWHSWKDFENRAEMAQAAAKSLNARSLPGLRRTLPSLMQSCLGCHETYRNTPNTFITH